MKKMYFYVVALVLLFASCEGKDSAINPKNVTAADFLELYDQDADYLRQNLKKYKLKEDGIDEDGNNYWTISNSKSSILISCDGYDVFVSLTMKNNKCVEVSLLWKCTSRHHKSIWRRQKNRL